MSLSNTLPELTESAQIQDLMASLSVSDTRTNRDLPSVTQANNATNFGEALTTNDNHLALPGNEEGELIKIQDGGTKIAEQKDRVPTSVATFSLREFLTKLNWRNDPSYQWPPVPVEEPSETSDDLLSVDDVLQEQEIELPVAALSLRNFLQVVNWKNEPGNSKIPKRKVSGPVQVEVNLSVSGIFSDINWG